MGCKCGFVQCAYVTEIRGIYMIAVVRVIMKSFARRYCNEVCFNAYSFRLKVLADLGIKRVLKSVKVIYHTFAW